MGFLTRGSRWSGGVLAVFLVSISSWAVACGGAAATAPSSSPSPVMLRDLQVTRRTWGGLCPQGACGSELVIGANGHWTLEKDANRSAGNLPPKDVAALVRAIKETRLDHATGVPTCAAAFDGTSVEYVWRYGAITHRVSSCEHPIDHKDALAVEIESLARTTGA